MILSSSTLELGASKSMFGTVVADNDRRQMDVKYSSARLIHYAAHDSVSIACNT